MAIINVRYWEYPLILRSKEGKRVSRYCDTIGMDSALATNCVVSALSTKDMERCFRQCDNECSFSVSFMSDGRCWSSTMNVRVRSLRSGQWVAKKRKTWNVGELCGTC